MVPKPNHFLGQGEQEGTETSHMPQCWWLGSLNTWSQEGDTAMAHHIEPSGGGKVLGPGSPWPGPWVSLAASCPSLAHPERGGWDGSLAGGTGVGPSSSLVWQEQLPWQRPELWCTCSTQKSHFIQPSDDTIPGVSQGSCLGGWEETSHPK